MKIELEKVIFEIEAADNAMAAFWDTEKGEAVYLSDELYTGERDEELEELIDNSPGRFLRFPTQYDIHEYSIMESFIESLSPGQEQDRLARAIHGRGAFRRFKDTVNALSLDKRWYAFRDNAYRDIAIRWCSDNGLEWCEGNVTAE